MSKVNTRATINANIKQNGNQEITGQVLNSTLNAMVTDYAEQAALNNLNEKVDALALGVFYGYFPDSASLPADVTTPGYAYVGLDNPYKIWNFNGESWSDSGTSIDMNDADEEDITRNADGKLQLKDRDNTDGMGYVILRKDKTLAEQMTQEKTIYEVKYDFDGAETLSIPNGSVLSFNGGIIKNSVITLNNVFVEADSVPVFEGCTFVGTFSNDKLMGTWFGLSEDVHTDNVDKLGQMMSFGKVIDLEEKAYYIGNSLDVSVLMTNGKLIYNGSAESYIIKLAIPSGLRNIQIVIDTQDYASTAILVDYTPYSTQFFTSKEHKFIIDGVWVNNNIATSFVENSCVLKIVYDKYKVVTEQDIYDLHLNGKIDIGIFINPILRNENDNPVFNTSQFRNIHFDSSNCALLVSPTMLSGDRANAKGGIGLLLTNFSNQYISGVIKPFMNLHNTNVYGDMVIPWDYFENNIPDSGLYVTESSSIVLSKEYFPDTKHFNKNVIALITSRSTGELYSTIPAFQLQSMRDENPYRKTGLPWGLSNIRPVIFTPEGGSDSYAGFLVQKSNTFGDNDINSIEVGFLAGSLRYRLWRKSTNNWGIMHHIYGDGGVPVVLYGNLTTEEVSEGDMRWIHDDAWSNRGGKIAFYQNGWKNAFGQNATARLRGTTAQREPGLNNTNDIGFMYFDTGLGKPIWWTGSKWVDATGADA